MEQEYPHDDFPYQKITLLEYNQKAKGGKQQMAENNNNFKSTVEALFQGMDGVISSKTVVGDAIHVGDTIILPLVDLKLLLFSAICCFPPLAFRLYSKSVIF